MYKNPLIKVREDQVIKPDGTSGIYGVIELAPSVSIIALNDEDEIYLTEQYRYPTKMHSWEIPAGGSEKQPPLVAAKRELWEETGLEAKTWKQVGTFQSLNGITNEIGYVFLARDLTQTISNKQKEDGISQIKAVPLKEALHMIAQGKITDCQTIAALHQVTLLLKRKI